MTRAAAPMLVRMGYALPWFGEAAGATLVMTDATAAQMLADRELGAVPDAEPPCPRWKDRRAKLTLSDARRARGHCGSVIKLPNSKAPIA